VYVHYTFFYTKHVPSVVSIYLPVDTEFSYRACAPMVPTPMHDPLQESVVMHTCIMQ